MRSDGVLAAVRRGARLALLVLAVATGVPVVTPCRADPASPRVIHLLVQTDPNMKGNEVANKFKSARDSTEGFNFAEEPVVVPVDPESYALLSSIVRRGTLQSGTDDQGLDDSRPVLIEPLKGRDGAWWLDLRDPSRFIESAKVVTVDAQTQKEESLSLDVSPRLQEKAPLRFHSPGAYILQLEKGRHPRSATLRITTEQPDGDMSEASEVTVGWPDVGRCYLVTLKGVTGDEARLFASLQDEKKVGNPIKSLYASNTTLYVGSFREKDPWLRPGFFSVTYLKPANTDPKRLWLRFPLTAAEEEAVRAEIDAVLAPDDGYKKLPDWLASRRLAAGEKLVPGASRWVEIQWDGKEGGFRIDVPIDTRAWKKQLEAAPDKVGDRAILVWEFENPKNAKDREALRVGGPSGKRYQVERVAWWLSGLPAAPNEK